ncbi:MAG: hypothetical protein GXO25_07965 [Euryarchaeota archaeon]|nr:hypothetical protein [Euryarchaeota archaeon]
MAYIEKEKVAEIRKRIKAAFNKEWKFSIVRDDYSGIRVAVMKAPIDFRKDYIFKHFEGDQERETVFKRLNEGKFEVNEFYINERWSGAARRAFNKIISIIYEVAGVPVNRNADDPGADYPDYNFFIWLQIGKWDKPCEFPRDAQSAAA